MDAAISASVNVLAPLHSEVYFPTYSNSLKDIGKYPGFSWTDATASGLQSLACLAGGSAWVEPLVAGSSGSTNASFFISIPILVGQECKWFPCWTIDPGQRFRYPRVSFSNSPIIIVIVRTGGRYSTCPAGEWSLLANFPSLSENGPKEERLPVKAKNPLDDLPNNLPAEFHTTLLQADNLRVERIVSQDRVSPSVSEHPGPGEAPGCLERPKPENGVAGNSLPRMNKSLPRMNQE